MLFRYYNLFSLQTPHVRRTNTQHLTNDSGRASLYISRKGSMTLEAAMAVPFFLCAVTALLYLFVFTAQNGQAYRRLMEKAEMLAVTAGQITEDDPYIRLYDYETAERLLYHCFSAASGGAGSGNSRMDRIYGGDFCRKRTGGDGL